MKRGLKLSDGAVLFFLDANPELRIHLCKAEYLWVKADRKLRNVLYRTINHNGSCYSMHSSDDSLPVDRRRPERREPFSACEPASPYRRRESDAVQSQLQRWINLADVALGEKLPVERPHRRRHLTGM